MQFDFNNHLNNEILQQNRLKARSYFIPYENKAINAGNIAGTKNTTRCHSLSGKWNFAYYENIREAFDTVEQTYTDEISVPDVWQFAGYEKPFYINVAYPFPATPPYVPDCAPGAVYNRKFSYKKAKNLSRSIITFQGVSAGFDLFINGKYVGYSQGSHYPSEFDVTDCLSDGENDIKVIVYKWTTGSWFECQDMLRNNGIFREVFITDIIENGIYDVAWTCKKHGNVYDCKVAVEMQTEKQSELCVTLTDKDGKVVFTNKQQVKSESIVEFSVENPSEWNVENPVLYDLSLSVFVSGQEVENVSIPVGFRTFSIENGVFKVNGVPVKCHGVNHHDTTPDRGCALTTEDYEKDFRLMKELNIDTIRFSHYPPCPAALELCDKMGFYVIDETDLETHGAFFMNETFDYFSNNSEYLAEYLDRIERLYARDKNHASIILWSLGNESGFGENQKKMAELLKSYDKDLLIHYEGAWNWEGENGFDVVSMMYPSCEKMVEMMNNRPNKPFFLCEYAHAMGVGPGGLKDYWTTIYENERSMGGCIWEWCDHAYYAENKKDFYFGGDGNEWIHDGNFCADGMLRADRDLTSAAYEIANVYRPFYSELFGNELTITSRLSFTGSEKYEIECKVIKDGKTAEVALDHDIKPLKTQKFNLSETLCGENVFVELTYKHNGKTCGSEQHVVKRTLPVIAQKQGGDIKVTENTKFYIFDCGNVKYYFSKHTATFEKIEKDGKNYLSDKKSLLYNPYAAVNAFVPNIYRYKMDNDMYINGKWREHGFDMMWNRVLSYSVEKVGCDYKITVDSLFSSPKRSKEFTNKFVYTIFANGDLGVDCTLTREIDNLPYLPRYGFLLNPNEQLFDKVEWEGYGPNENYSDYKEAAKVGVYSKDIKDMFYEYVSPQENGERCGISYLSLSGKNGAKLSVYAKDDFFSFKVNDFIGKYLQNARHITGLKRGETLELAIDGYFSGVGSNSCGPELPEDKRVTDKVLQFGVYFRFE